MTSLNLISTANIVLPYKEEELIMHCYGVRACGLFHIQSLKESQVVCIEKPIILIETLNETSKYVCEHVDIIYFRAISPKAINP